MNESRFRNLLAELIDENPFAIRAVLRILGLEFTTSVSTLAVTCEVRPRLLVNVAFLTEYCRTDDEVKAVVCHEFLHVLLRHTEERRPYTPARHLALDAVINAIIHREHGNTYSAMMSRYYADAPGLWRLLRPMNGIESSTLKGTFGLVPKDLPAWVRAWASLYAGQLVADDIEDLARQVSRGLAGNPALAGTAFELGPTDLNENRLLGGHDDQQLPLPEPLAEALDETLRSLNGSGIWRSPHTRGVGAMPCPAEIAAAGEPLVAWRRRTLELLREHLVPDPRSHARIESPRDYRIPVLASGDRRAFLRAQWSPFLPEALWTGVQAKREGTAQVYLDVSGSMDAEMPLIVALLAQLSPWIRRPFWAFSNEVAPATIVDGQLRTASTGGTSMACVLAHVERTRPAAAVVVTDGYIESLPRSAARAALAATRLTALVTRDGGAAQLHNAGIPYRQLDKVPT